MAYSHFPFVEVFPPDSPRQWFLIEDIHTESSAPTGVTIIHVPLN